MTGELSDDEQDDMVQAIGMGLDGGLDGDEVERLTALLDADHQMEVSALIREFADGAIGSEHWDSDA